MDASKSAFLERLYHVLGHRKRHQWGARLGLTSNRIHRLFQETDPLPSTEELALIGEAENLNLNWLVYGEGSPYRVQIYAEPAAFTTALRAHLESDWASVDCLVADGDTAIFLRRPRSTQYKDRPIKITTTLALVGPTSNHLADLLPKTELYVAKPSLVHEVRLGHISAFGLFGDDSHPGMVADLPRSNLRQITANLPITPSWPTVNLETLVACYNRVTHFNLRTQQDLSDKKIAELTWVMYETETDNQREEDDITESRQDSDPESA